MMTSEVLQILKSEKEKYEMLAEKVAGKALPDSGKLIIRKRSKRVDYYLRRNGKDEYLSKKDIEKIRAVELRNYLDQLRKVSEKNATAYQIAEEALESVNDPDCVFEEIPEEKRNLIRPYVEELDEEFAKKWEDYVPKQNTIKSNVSFKVSNGVTVRSKSELIIAEKLVKEGIPFYYERPTLIDCCEYWYPDFIVLNKRTKEEFYWEHFGLISDPAYCANMQEKIESYARNDIILGKNLIISMESSEHPLDTEYVDKIIKQFLL